MTTAAGTAPVGVPSLLPMTVAPQRPVTSLLSGGHRREQHHASPHPLPTVGAASASTWSPPPRQPTASASPSAGQLAQPAPTPLSPASSRPVDARTPSVGQGVASPSARQDPRPTPAASVSLAGQPKHTSGRLTTTTAPTAPIRVGAGATSSAYDTLDGWTAITGTPTAAETRSLLSMALATSTASPLPGTPTPVRHPTDPDPSSAARPHVIVHIHPATTASASPFQAPGDGAGLAPPPLASPVDGAIVGSAKRRRTSSDPAVDTDDRGSPERWRPTTPPPNESGPTLSGNRCATGVGVVGRDPGKRMQCRGGASVVRPLER